MASRLASRYPSSSRTSTTAASRSSPPHRAIAAIAEGRPSGEGRPFLCRRWCLQEAPERFAAGTRVVVGFEHFQLVPLDEVLPGEEDGRDLLLLDQAAQALGMDVQGSRRFYQVQVVVKRRVRHRVPSLRHVWTTANTRE